MTDTAPAAAPAAPSTEETLAEVLLEEMAPILKRLEDRIAALETDNAKFHATARRFEEIEEKLQKPKKAKKK